MAFTVHGQRPARRALRVLFLTPTSPCKDWGELPATGRNMIRHFWHPHFVAPRSREELLQERWGPAVGDLGLGIDGPLSGARVWGDDGDAYVIAERAAIQAEQGS